MGRCDHGLQSWVLGAELTEQLTDFIGRRLVGSGGALSSGGPVSLLIGFGTVGLIAFAIMQSLGEITTLYPGGGAFISLAERFVDKAFAVSVGWSYWFIWVCVLANEYNVISSICVFWSKKLPRWGYFLIFWFVFLAFQMLGVEAFGEAEFGLAWIKLLALGFRYWRDPGPWNNNGFNGVAQVFVFCSTFYAGVESVAVAASECKNPGVAVPQATRQVFFRIIFIYMGSALFFGLSCPANADGLINGSSRALQSPMTIAIQNAGWEGGVQLINTFIFLTVLSAVNSSIYIGSRTILYLAKSGGAPRFLSYTNRRGVPVYAIILTNLVGVISQMNNSVGGAAAYSYIVNLSGVSTFLVASISFIHIRFRDAWKIQGRSISELPFRSLWYPLIAYFGLAANIFLALVQGWTTLSPFEAGLFVDTYILLPLFGIIFVGFKLVNKTHYWRLEEIDLVSGRRRDLDKVGIKESFGKEAEYVAKKPAWWQRMWKDL
ncbi:General amino acid permease [Oleoguttula sp. CCFEE 5521]